jgi:hypothetical protein
MPFRTGRPSARTARCCRAPYPCIGNDGSLCMVSEFAASHPKFLFEKCSGRKPDAEAVSEKEYIHMAT